MSSTVTTVLLVPGAWHGPEIFDSVAKMLQEAGYRTDIVDLPSVGPPKHFPNFSADVTKIREHISKAADAGEKIMVVAHSYGSIPSSEAIQGLDVATRQKEGKEGGVAHFFFCTAFVIPEGASLIAAFGGPLPWFVISEDQMEVNPETPAETFYNDMALEDVKAAVSKLKPFSYQCMHSPCTYAAWKHVPSTYLYTTKDEAIPSNIQEMMVEVTAKGYDIKTAVVNTSHSPMLSQPKETAEAIRRAAGESL